MSKHPLLKELQKLKESSKEAVSDANNPQEDILKKYLHIERPVEKALKDIILKSHDSKRPILLLLCGNVGDGKSHLLSTLKKDSEVADQLRSFNIHNDATESFSPDETCIETLEKKLQPFSDINIGSNSAKWIVAINLGTLSNFLEEKKEQFSKLSSFVDKHGILETNRIAEPDEYRESEIFQFVNFTNYHFFELTKEGAKATLVEKLLSLIVNPTASNPLYTAYASLESCDWSSLCPIKHNFEFLSNENNRKVIAHLLLQTILKHKLIISFRQILNFIHDILVPYDITLLSVGDYELALKKLSAKKRLEYYTPFYLFENPKLSKIFSALHKLDPCAKRNERLDDEAIQLHISDNPLEVFVHHLSPIQKYLEHTISSIEKQQHILFKLFLRLRYFKHHEDPIYHDDYFKDFALALYAFNRKDASALRNTNELVKNAIIKWGGTTYEKDKIMLPGVSSLSKYRIFRHIQFKAILPAKNAVKDEEVLQRFRSELEVAFSVSNSKEGYKVSIDYSLFVVLNMVNQGYRPNKLDRNNYYNFVKYVEQLISANAEEADLFIDEVNIGKSMDFKLTMNEYGEYQFIKI